MKKFDVFDYPSIRGWSADAAFSDSEWNMLPSLLSALDHYSDHYRTMSAKAISQPTSASLFEAQKWLIVVESLSAVLACCDVQSDGVNHRGDNGADIIRRLDEVMCSINPILPAQGADE